MRREDRKRVSNLRETDNLKFVFLTFIPSCENVLTFLDQSVSFRRNSSRNEKFYFGSLLSHFSRHFTICQFNVMLV